MKIDLRFITRYYPHVGDAAVPRRILQFRNLVEPGVWTEWEDVPLSDVVEYAPGASA